MYLMKLSHSPRIQNFLWSILHLVLILGLCSCAGDGRTGGNPPSPTLQLEFRQVNIFHFTWTDVSNETAYRLLEDPDGQSGYSVIATIDADTTFYDLYVPLPDRINASYILEALRNGFYQSMGEVFVTGSLADAVGYFKASNTGEYDGFGVSVALSGDGRTLAVGAPYESSAATGAWHPGDPGYSGSQMDNSAPASGAVYIFAYTISGWEQEAYLKAWNAESFDAFGGQVALSYYGDTLAVGAMYEDSGSTGGEDDNSMPDSGAAYIFTRAGNSWAPGSLIKAFLQDEGDRFGERLALSGDGNTLAVSAMREDSAGNPIDNSVPDSGAVYLFFRDGLDWQQQAYLKPPLDVDINDQFGSSLALSEDGGVLAVGNDFNDSESGFGQDNALPDSGAVFVFTRTGNTWGNAAAFIKASNAEPMDYFGSSVSLSADGNTLAVGAPGEDGNGLGESNNSLVDSGAVYVFEYSSGLWTQKDYLKASSAGTGDAFGSSVSLSGDGASLAVGAPFEDSWDIGIGGDSSDDSAEDSGAVYLFYRPDRNFFVYSYIKASNTEPLDVFGHAVDLSWDGLTLAAGAPDEESNATGIGGDADNNLASYSGAVYLY